MSKINAKNVSVSVKNESSGEEGWILLSEIITKIEVVLIDELKKQEKEIISIISEIKNEMEKLAKRINKDKTIDTSKYI